MKAVVTKEGARRLNRPDLEGKEVEYNTTTRPNDTTECADDMYCDGMRIGANLSFTGNNPGLIKKTE